MPRNTKGVGLTSKVLNGAELGVRAMGPVYSSRSTLAIAEARFGAPSNHRVRFYIFHSQDKDFRDTRSLSP